MFGHQVNFPTNFSSHGASYPEKLATSFVSFIIDHPVPGLVTATVRVLLLVVILTHPRA